MAVAVAHSGVSIPWKESTEEPLEWIGHAFWSMSFRCGSGDDSSIASVPIAGISEAKNGFVCL